jgi:Protein of unknown function (DUF3800)
LRFAHLDEAGTSSREPNAVVAGIVTDPDRQWIALHQYLSDMADALIPPDLREGFIFHAKDIWHGSKLFKDERFTPALRSQILRELAQIPKKFDVPVIVGAIRKVDHQWTVEYDREASCYAIAFGMAAIGVEVFMRSRAGAQEVAHLIAEDSGKMRQNAKWGYKLLQGNKESWKGELAKVLPLTRIVEQPLFAAKDESSILQVADLLAFVICRRLNGREDVQYLVDEFKDNIIGLPVWADASLRMGKE